MSIEAALTLIVMSQLGLGGMLVWHLFKCRDLRLDIEKMKGRLEQYGKDLR